MHESSPVLVLALVLLGCGGSPAGPDAASAPDASSMPDAHETPSPVGVWAQPPPYNAFMSFEADGTQRVARTRADLATAPFATGTWELSGSRLTLTNTVGACSTPAAHQVGAYEIDVSPEELSFTLVVDSCPERNVIGGETWTRQP